MEPEMSKDIIEKSSGVFNSLFGETFSEIGGLIADQLKFRRLKNQINIFEKAENLLTEKKLKRVKVDLKVLAPLLQYASLEENEILQDKWSNLTVEIVTKTGKNAFFQNCTEALNKMSVDDVEVLKGIFRILVNDIEFYTSPKENRQNRKFPYITTMINGKWKSPRNTINDIIVNIRSCAKSLRLDFDYFNTSVSNLTQIGILVLTPYTYNEGAQFNETSKEIDVYLTTVHNSYFYLTPFGEDFIKAIGIADKHNDN